MKAGENRPGWCQLVPQNRYLLFAAVIVSCLVAGCGGQSQPSTASRAPVAREPYSSSEPVLLTTVEHYYAAVTAEEGTRACSMLSARALAGAAASISHGRLSPTRRLALCATAVAPLFKHYHRKLTAKGGAVEVSSVSITGSRAIAGLNSRTIPALVGVALVLENSHWKIDQLLGSHLHEPLAAPPKPSASTEEGRQTNPGSTPSHGVTASPRDQSLPGASRPHANGTGTGPSASSPPVPKITPASSADTAAITRLVQAYQAAVAGDDGAKGCELLTEEQQKSVAEFSTDKSCAEGLAKVCKHSVQEKVLSPSANVTSVQVGPGAGGTGTVNGEDSVSFTTTSTEGVTVSVQDPARREDGIWKLDANGSFSASGGSTKTSSSKVRDLANVCL